MARNRKKCTRFPSTGNLTQWINKMTSNHNEYQKQQTISDRKTKLNQFEKEAKEEISQVFAMERAFLDRNAQKEHLKALVKKQKKDKRDRNNRVTQKKNDVGGKIDIILKDSGSDLRIKNLKISQDTHCDKIAREDAFRFWRTQHNEEEDRCLFCRGTFALEAAHIWDNANCEESYKCDYERNIFILCAVCHYLFDEGKVYIDDDKKLVLQNISEEANIESNQLLKQNYVDSVVMDPTIDVLTDDHILSNQLKKETLRGKGKLE